MLHAALFASGSALQVQCQAVTTNSGSGYVACENLDTALFKDVRLVSGRSWFNGEGTFKTDSRFTSIS
ncbi:hypothetical protein PR003_g10253 [Phytophthora rubi]|uniref:Pectate lyase n=1 Tax=Phytophthora rubi TaxID=129364 RepID=A0A6A4FE22_9STRA|nr:hypothetical protein PR002_g11041 [Phytophthora rubi]KAE9033099.1 hypothetical protein PR001_g10305 [Phytophthora rubi]KAE9340891.1 hypothetical protein PR003_g10253 [Phytophthora rubi]